ncbi:MAG: phospholipid carrier-dependent glycosyltransferase [Proteobacteria bacterium]|nr:phospholipid carrier-dependent glycosyltransferase [Pseudomonadota bacterium]
MMAPSLYRAVRSNREYILLSLLFLWCAYCCFFNIHASLSPADETLYAHVTQSIFSDGQWLRPLLDGHPYYAKIPFVQWCSAALMYLFGESPGTHRLFSALCGFGTFLITYALARRMGLSKVGAGLAVLALSGSWVFVFLNGVRRGCLDAPLNFFLIAAAYAAWRQREQGLAGIHPIGWRVVWIASFACALLSKSAAGLIVIPVTAAIMLIRAPTRVTRSVVLRFLLDSAIAALIPLTYYIPAIARYPDLYTVGIQQEILTRISHSYNKAKGPFFYISQLLAPWRMFPPFLVVPVFLYSVWRAYRTRESTWPILCVWFALIVIGFSLVRTRWPWYITPALPAGCILLGAVFDDLKRGVSIAYGHRSLTMIVTAAARVLLVIGVGSGVMHTAGSVWKSGEIRAFDRALLAIRRDYGTPPVVLSGNPQLESTEKVSVRMVSRHAAALNSREEILTLLNQHKRVVVIGLPKLLESFDLGTVTQNLSLVPPWRRRKHPLAVAFLEQG